MRLENFSRFPIFGRPTWSDLSKEIDASVTTACSNGHPQLSAADIEAVRSRYRAAVSAGAPLQVAGTATISNAPRVHFRYGAVVGALLGPVYPRDQVKANTESRVYDPDPLARAMTIAAVSYYPVPYDSTRASVSWVSRSLMGTKL